MDEPEEEPNYGEQKNIHNGVRRGSRMKSQRQVQYEETRKEFKM